jgi:hypothetical protein
LELNYDIRIIRIEFYNRVSAASHRTRNAFFTGANGVPLGAPFTALNSDLGRSIIEVNHVITNVIQLNITSSFGNVVGANEIIIHAIRV